MSPTAVIELSCQTFRCDIAPDIGGCVAGLWLDAIPVLRVPATPALSSARQAGCFPLLPFSNRVGHASLLWNGSRYPLQTTAGDEPHAIHGVGWQRPWRVLEASAQHARLAYEHLPDESWPFAFAAVQTFRLSAHALDLSLSLCNRSAHIVPAGLGWHPYFVKRQRSHLSFDASGRWEMGADKLPTHRAASPGLDTDCAALEVDHCYDGWPGVVHLRDEQLHTRVTSSLDRLVVFTNDSRHFVAMEPVSHVNNAFHLMGAPGASAAGLGVRQLQAGESTHATMRIHVARSTALVPTTPVD